MVGTGSGRAADGTTLNLLLVVLRVHFPNHANLTRPFVTSNLESTDSPSFFEPISLVAYAEEDYASAATEALVRPWQEEAAGGSRDASQIGYEGSRRSHGGRQRPVGAATRLSGGGLRRGHGDRRERRQRGDRAEA
ncbi:hypothetical protein GUJ93_ZPchr0011g28058 [Zizania palustris]|uniref:Uncharacterized protein n=1 Tax=Zizania palustris TaxID=103762 RepID=A0A8J6BQF6_ZIZPA|nr:hypothetical protein GUJ93_ZPchr0011g28058 [Zizania palustris]